MRLFHKLLAVYLTICFANNAVAGERQNIKIIPKSFYGKWVGLHHAGHNISPAEAKKVCKFDYDFQDTSWILEFDKNGRDIKSITYYEDVEMTQPISYSAYSNSWIKGTHKGEYSELGDEQPTSVFTENFDYRLKGNYLYYTHNDPDAKTPKLKTTLFIKCS